MQQVSGHVFRVVRSRGPVWYAKYRLPSGRQVQKKLGPAWTGRGRPAAGYFTKRTAEDWLRGVLDEARRGTLAGMVQTGAVGRGRGVAALLRARAGVQAVDDDRLPAHVGADHARPGRRGDRGRDAGAARSPEEVWALVRAAGSAQDGALFLTGAFTGLRMGELLALQWGDVDFAGDAIRVRRSYNAHGGVGTPKSGKVRSVPMVPDVASALARLAEREGLVGEEHLVFPGELGLFQNASALRDRYKTALARAGLRPLRFRDLRHTFGTLAVRRAEVPAVQAWMGHADIQTTMRYVHHRDRGGEARLLAEAFAVDPVPQPGFNK